LRWKRGRIRRLEEEIAESRADQADLRQRLQIFESIAAAAAGAGPGSLPGLHSVTTPTGPLPSSLIVAANEVRARQEPVWLDVGDGDVIAVVGGPGDPREWWSAIWGVSKGKQTGEPRQVGDAS
jgi:hypothetical protein